MIGYTPAPGFHLYITGISFIGIMKGKVDINITQLFRAYRVVQVEIGASKYHAVAQAEPIFPLARPADKFCRISDRSE